MMTNDKPKDVEGGDPTSGSLSTKEVETASAKEEQTRIYPEDCFSLLVSERKGKHWGAYVFGTLVPLLQMTIFVFFLVYTAASATVEKYIDDSINIPGDSANHWAHDHMYEDTDDEYIFWFKKNVDIMLPYSQAVAMISYTLFPEGGMADLVKSIQQLRTGNPLVSVFRLVHCFLALFAVAILIMTSNEIIDVFLNFAAMNFAADLDEQAFKLAMEGVFGEALQVEAVYITDIKEKSKLSVEEKKKQVRAHWIAMALVGIGFGLIFAGKVSESFEVTGPLISMFNNTNREYNHLGAYGASEAPSYGVTEAPSLAPMS